MTDNLLSRLQSLTEPSREIDAEIALANGWRQLNHDLWIDSGGQCHPEPPRFTGSLDAALTLIPEDCEDWAVNRDSACGWHYWASIGGGTTRPASVGANPAIALLIAIMKAKEETKP